MGGRAPTRSLFSAQSLKEGLQLEPALELPHATDHIEAVIEAWVSREVPDGAAEAAFGVETPEMTASDAGVDQRTGAHGARLEGHIHPTFFQSPRTEGRGCLPDGEQLGVRRGVELHFAAIEAATEYFVPAHHHRTHWHVTGERCLFGERQRDAHEVMISLKSRIHFAESANAVFHRTTRAG